MWRNLMKSFQDLDRERMLERIGLEPRRSAAEKVLPIFAHFARASGHGLLASGVGPV